MPPRAYEPGHRPAGPAVYRRLARPMRELVTTLESLLAEAEAYERRRRRALLWLPVLAALCLAGLLLDVALGMPAWVFTRQSPVWLGAAALVAWAAAPHTLRRSALADALLAELSKVGALLLILLLFAALGRALVGASWVALAGLLALLWLPLLAFSAGTLWRIASALVAHARTAWAGPPEWRAPLRDLSALAHALEALVAPGQPVTGFVDLSGVEQPTKHLRLPPRPDLAPHRLFRDEWARLDLTLRSGSRLRLRLVETLDRRGHAANLAPYLASSGATPRSAAAAGRHALLASYWPARPRAPQPSRRPPHGIARLQLGPRRALVELPLAERRLPAEAVDAALRLLDPELRLGRDWSRA